MTYSYDIANPDHIVSQMRLELGDHKVDPDGMLPEGNNFSDEELTHFYSQEGDDFWAAIARSFDAAAARWSAYPWEVWFGPERHRMKPAEYYAERASNIRTKSLKPTATHPAKEEYAITEDANTEYS